MPTQFVILHHVLHGGEHWDLMLEHGDTLLTWQLQRRPERNERGPIPARRIGNHRKHYLDYEGPISGDRGRVTRIERGTVALRHLSDDRVECELHGSWLTGRYVLAATGDAWEFASA